MKILPSSSKELEVIFWSQKGYPFFTVVKLHNVLQTPIHWIKIDSTYTSNIYTPYKFYLVLKMLIKFIYIYYFNLFYFNLKFHNITNI